MSLAKVKSFFQSYGMEDRIKEFSVSSATVALAAQALDSEPERIAKTISLRLPDCTLLLVAAGDMKIDNQKYKSAFGVKAKMLSFEEVEKLTGHPVGGVCPFAVADNVKVFLDVSLKRFDTVFPACGSANSAIELTLPELEKYSGANGWADVCKSVVS